MKVKKIKIILSNKKILMLKNFFLKKTNVSIISKIKLIFINKLPAIKLIGIKANMRLSKYFRSILSIEKLFILKIETLLFIS